MTVFLELARDILNDTRTWGERTARRFEAQLKQLGHTFKEVA